jgi:hypothetical protein
MNQYVVNIVGKMIFVVFNHIVEKGSVEIWPLGEKVSPLAQTDISQTNFVNMDVPSVKGKFRLEINADGEHYSSPLSIR